MSKSLVGFLCLSPPSIEKGAKEEQICRFLEKTHLREGINFYNVIPEFEIIHNFHVQGRVDYKCHDRNGTDVYVEVKNWFLKIKDVLQVIRYYIHIKEHRLLGKNSFRFIVICEGLSKTRNDLLEKLGIEVWLLPVLRKNTEMF